MEEAIATIRPLQGLKIRHIDVHITEKWSVVFETCAEAEKAKKHPRWIHTAILGARLKQDT
jgi:hypothetical protein